VESCSSVSYYLREGYDVSVLLNVASNETKLTLSAPVRNGKVTLRLKRGWTFPSIPAHPECAVIFSGYLERTDLLTASTFQYPIYGVAKPNSFTTSIGPSRGMIFQCLYHVINL